MSCCQSFSRKCPVNLVSPAPLPVSHVHNSGAKLQLQKPLKYSCVKVQISRFESPERCLSADTMRIDSGGAFLSPVNHFFAFIDVESVAFAH